MLTLDAVYLSNIGGPLFNPMIKNNPGRENEFKSIWSYCGICIDDFCFI